MLNGHVLEFDTLSWTCNYVMVITLSCTCIFLFVKFMNLYLNPLKCR
jgi:hypothetical protein